MAKTYGAKQKKVRVEIEGAEEVIQMLNAMGKNAEDVLSKAAESGADIALAEARRRCPVRTGKLKAGLTLKAGKKTQLKADIQVVHGKGEFYGTFVELGTKKSPARPFMRPAVDENREKIADAVTKEIYRAIGSVK